MNKFKYLLLTVLSFSLVNAQGDPVTEENKLLKSWGLKFNARGYLKFRTAQSAEPQYQPWRPDLSVYRLNPMDVNGLDAMPPLVISAKQKSEK
ncbi:MAG: hypothetical protein QNJ56_09240 [Gammaproteobacteria bacterium]|nr:hypothetical protein [Gammaproteobacteria bacterium]